jgi:aryl-alcohol dehydrogenase-like predicted oxidoreductase
VLEAGITVLDTAPWYGHGTSEIVVGLALKTILSGASANDDDNYDGHYGRPSPTTSTAAAASAESSDKSTAIRRADLTVNTKVGRYEADPARQFDFTRETTCASIRRSLERLQITYVDVLQLHDPEFAPSLEILVEETIPAMLEAQSLGYCKQLGLTGYPLNVQRQILVRTMEAYGHNVWDQCLVYSHFNLHDTSLFFHPTLARSRIIIGSSNTRDAGQGEADDCDHDEEPHEGQQADDANGEPSQLLAAFCRDHGIRIMAAAPLSMGLLTSSGPPSWHPASDELKEACREASRVIRAEMSTTTTTTTGDPPLEDAATAELALLFALSSESIPCTLVGMKSVRQVQVAQRIASRFSSDRTEDHGTVPFCPSSCEGHRQDTLWTILTEPERRAFEKVMDPARGPFARVWKNGAYRWDGVQCARAFWRDQVGVEQEPWHDNDT